MRSGETLTKWEVTSFVLNLISCHCLSSYIRTFLGSGKICFMHSVWKVSRWVLTIEGELSRPVVGAGPGAAFSCWDPRPMGLGGLTGVSRSGQDRGEGIWGAGLWDRSWAPFVSPFTLFLLPLCYSLQFGANMAPKQNSYWDHWWYVIWNQWQRLDY